MVLDLVCFSDINKTLPGPFNDPPTKDEVEVLLKVKLPIRVLQFKEFCHFDGIDLDTEAPNLNVAISTQKKCLQRSLYISNPYNN